MRPWGWVTKMYGLLGGKRLAGTRTCEMLVLLRLSGNLFSGDQREPWHFVGSLISMDLNSIEILH